MTGSTLSVDASVAFNWNGGSSLSGSGTLNFMNPSSWLTLNVDMVLPSAYSMIMASNVTGAGNLTCDGPLTLNSYYAEINGPGTLAINENSIWNAGRVNRVTTLAVSKTLTMATGTDKWLGADLTNNGTIAVSYTHLRAHETVLDIVCRLLLENKKTDYTVFTL